MEVTTAQMKEWEQRADAAGLSYRCMMENAGRAAANHILTHAPIARRVAVFCGKGNNGGDGFVVARLLHQAGTEVQVILVEGEPSTPDACANLARARDLRIPVFSMDDLTETASFLAQTDVVVDGIYGTGFHGALRPAGQKAARRIAACPGCVVSLDVPSGVTADTGAADPEAVRATLTVAFHAVKPCHRLAPDFCGEVVVADIGITAALETAHG